MHRNFPRLAAVLVTALAGLVACAQGPGTPEPRKSLDTAPAFADPVADQTYTVGEVIGPLTLPAASGGNGTLSYSLTPTVPGLSFAAATRTLNGSPTTAGTYAMTYQAVDGDANTAASDAATLTFTITVQNPDPPDTAPTFAGTVGDQTYTVGEVIASLTLPRASGGNGSLSYSLTPAVPGLVFAVATRTLSGTPTAAGSYTMTYQAVDGDTNTAASDAALLTFTISVLEPAPPPDSAPAFAGSVPNQTYTVGETIGPLTLPEASGGNGSLSYSLTPTVPGLTFAAATRTLSGTPTAAGGYTMTYQAVDGDANTAASDAASLTFTISVLKPAPPPDSAPAFAGSVPNQTYTVGETIGPLTLPEASGGNGSLSYSLTPTVPGLTFAAATRTLSGTPTAAGSYTMTYQAVDGDTNTAASDAALLTFTISVLEPTPPPDSAPAFAGSVPNQTYTVGETISPLTLPAASGGNGSLSYSLTPTVPGLTFAAATRTLSGSPTTAGTYAMTYQAVDGDTNTAASDAASLTFTISVLEPAPPPDSAPAFAGSVPNQTYTVGETISSLTLPEASGGNGSLSYSLTPTVPGLTFAAATRTLSGSPTTAGTYAMTYQAVDGDANTAASDAATLTFTITVQNPEPPDTAPTFAGTVGDQTYTVGEVIASLTLPRASGGNGSLSYSLTPAVPGLVFAAATRTLSGSPTTAGTYAMTYQAVDSDANTAASDAATLTFTITVQNPDPPDTAPTFAGTVGDQTYTVGEVIASLTLPRASGGNGTLSYSLAPTVPGLTFAAATRTLSGTPTTAGSYTMTYQAVDGDANTAASDAATLTFMITVQFASTPYADCSSDAGTWRGLRVCSERLREGYDRDEYGTGYRSLEDDIIAALPATMKADGKVYTPYSCIPFDITSNGTAATDIEHIVALAEAHDSGIDDDRRRDIASDLDNLTIADPTVNRSQKGARDAAEWTPTHHGAWFAERVIQVKLEYGLTVDPAERNALEALLAGGGAQLNCVN